MEQHAIPQNVSSYQFKLVGDMTLKQFFQVAGGILGGLIIHSLPLLAIIKWPFIGISVLLGVGLAFLPFEERPLERWIFAFFRAVYSPTMFVWKKGSITGKLFQDEPLLQTDNTPQDVALNDYLAKSNQVPSAKGNLDKAEGNFLENLTGLFKTVPAQPAQPSQPTAPAPVNKLQIPQNLPTPVQPTVHHVVVEEQPLYSTPVNPAVSNIVAPVMAGNNMISTTQAMFSTDAAPPSPPTYPNVVVGQIIDQDRKIVEGVIMEIRDSSGRPVRALRSNKVGHFITVTQLDNGHYEIIIEKDGFEFTPVSFEATGAIIPPILVRGKRLSPLLEMPIVPVKTAYSIN